jgi:hypothetical protein
MLPINCGVRIGQNKRTGKFLGNVPTTIGMGTILNYLLLLKDFPIQILVS